MLRSSNGTAYQISGPEDAQAIVLIHGIGLNRQIWRDYESAFAQRYRVVSYDLFGHGGSSTAPQVLSLTILAEQLRQLLEDLGVDRCAAVGFSLGGMINRRFALDHPDRCSALVILNSPHERSVEAQRLVEERLAQTRGGGSAATLQASLERWFTPEFLRTHAKTIDEVSEWIMATDPDAFAQCRQILASDVLELIRPQPPIAHPGLVITCENDTGSTPAMSVGIAAEIEGAETVIVPQLQHLGMLEQPALFIDPITRFLQRNLA